MATTKAKVTEKHELMTEDMSFMEQYAGQGFEDMSANATSTPYLSMVQPDSAAESEKHPAGTWRNTATDRNYGPTVKVVVLAFRTIWNERESDPPFRTVGRYPVNGVEVEIRQPPKGKRGFPKMINPESGNEVQELFVYALILPDYPEDGVLFFNPTVGSMKVARSWNTQLHAQLLQNGAQAPIFGFKWNVTTGLVPNPQQPSKNIAKLVSIERDAIVDKELFETAVAPQLTAIKQNVLSITSGQVDLPEED